MEFRVVEVVPDSGRSMAFLEIDNWDDWFKFQTLYYLYIFDENGKRHNIGGVKIARFGMRENQRIAKLPDVFDVLGEKFFSLGQDDSYYVNLQKLGEDVREDVLRSLRDVALDADLFERALDEEVMGVSLLRSVRKATVRGQFRRLASGGARLSRYAFIYQAPRRRSGRAPIELAFNVEPGSNPPTNIHVLIGRNGVGKTFLLNNMARAIAEPHSSVEDIGEFSPLTGGGDHDPFANLVSVTFSAFDPFPPLPERQNKATSVQYAYIGLKRTGKSADGKPPAPKSPQQLSAEFGRSVRVCRQGARMSRWRRALVMLESDPIFRDAELSDLATYSDEDEMRSQATKVFSKFSSGHKIVLLTITRLVETVDERTLILLDEPEAHLHPPLLSAFIRALSDLLTNRNGVAIIATHSPVILQEVPKDCVWKIRRSGGHVVAERPEIETFGENVGVLTREVFGLEVTRSGFHKLVSDVARRADDYDSVVQKFGGQLGGEARAIVRTLLATQKIKGK